jgi:hypothetical protein
VSSEKKEGAAAHRRRDPDRSVAAAGEATSALPRRARHRARTGAGRARRHSAGCLGAVSLARVQRRRRHAGRQPARHRPRVLGKRGTLALNRALPPPLIVAVGGVSMPLCVREYACEGECRQAASGLASRAWRATPLAGLPGRPSSPGCGSMIAGTMHATRHDDTARTSPTASVERARSMAPILTST